MMKYELKADKTPVTFIQKRGDGNEIKTLETFLSEDVSESLHEMIRTNVLTATRNFHHRVEAFKEEILRRKNNPSRIILQITINTISSYDCNR